MKELSNAALCPVHPVVHKAVLQLRSKAKASAVSSNVDVEKVVADCLSLISRYVKNILSKPDDEKYQKINCSKAAFQTRIGNIPGGFEVMASLGMIINSPLSLLPTAGTHYTYTPIVVYDSTQA